MIAHHVLDLSDARIAKFHHAAAIQADDVVMLFIAIRFLKLRHIFAKLVFGHQVAGKQQVPKYCKLLPGLRDTFYFSCGYKAILRRSDHFWSKSLRVWQNAPGVLRRLLFSRYASKIFLTISMVSCWAMLIFYQIKVINKSRKSECFPLGEPFPSENQIAQQT